MAFIYVITNNVNGKQYVGQTASTIEERWKEHLKAKNRNNFGHRPLYHAMKKYGIENFSIEQLEECSIEDVSLREIYWIGKLDTYKNGYNATIGGDGKTLYDYKTISEKYKELESETETAIFFNCDRGVVKKSCKLYNVPVKSSGQIAKENNGKSIIMCDLKTHEPICSFQDMSDAARYLINQGITTADVKNISCNIGRVANGQRKSCYKYFWKFNN